MVRRLLLLLLALQAGAALALAWACWRWWRQAWGAQFAHYALPAALCCLAAGAGAVVLVRLFISLNNFALSWRARSAADARHALTPARAWRWFGGEFAASMHTSSLAMLRPVGWQVMPAGTARGLPVLLLHGYGCNSGYWRPMSALLARAGISHYGIDMEPLGAAIDDYVPQVHAAVEQLCARSGSAQVVVLAHSMGGLVARAYLRRHGAGRIARVVTLGTPHHGTRLADLGLGRNAAQMRLDSGWLRDLAAAEANLQRALFCSIYSVHDNIVAPQDSSVLPGARNLVFSAVGHVALGHAPEIMACALAEIEAATACPERQE